MKNCRKNINQFSIGSAASQEKKINKQSASARKHLNTIWKSYNGKINTYFHVKKYSDKRLFV